jgi:hypothetical protein
MGKGMCTLALEIPKSHYSPEPRKRHLFFIPIQAKTFIIRSMLHQRNDRINRMLSNYSYYDAI